MSDTRIGNIQTLKHIIISNNFVEYLTTFSYKPID